MVFWSILTGRNFLKSKKNQYRTFNSYFCFFSAVLILVTKIQVSSLRSQLECWNIGFWASGSESLWLREKMESWVIVKFLLTGIKQRNIIFFKSLFQYSNIPLFHVRVKNISLKFTFIFNKLQNFRDVKLFGAQGMVVICIRRKLPAYYYLN